MTKQDAIEIIRMAIAQIEWEYPMDYAAAFDMAIEALNEPEIIRCKDCRHGEKCNSVYLCGKSRGFGMAHDPSWFCADGEKR